MSRFVLPAFFLLAFGLAGPASAQDLKAAAARQELLAQQLKANVEDAIKASFRQDPRDAKAALSDMLFRVNDSTVLLASQRDEMRRRLQQRLNAVNEALRAKTVAQDQRPAPRDPDRPKAKSTYQPPGGGGGAASVAKDFIGSAKAAAQNNADLIRKREAGVLGVAKSIEDSSNGIPDKEINFPSYWKELTQRRKDMVGPQLTKKEVAVLKTLNSVMSVDYTNDEFKGVINHLQEKTGLNILIDEGSLTELNVDYKDPVNLKVQKVTVRTILKKILGDKGLTYIIKEGTIQVMTPKKAAEHTVVRTYQIDDLIQPSPQAQMMFGPFVAQAQMMQNAQQLMNLIQMTVEPNYWAPNGPGTMAFYPPTRSLIIRASAEMHYQMSSPGLFGGR